MSPAWIRPRVVKSTARNPRGRTYQILYRRGGRGYRIETAGTFKTEREAKMRRDLVAGWLAQGLNPKDELARIAIEPTRVRTIDDWANLYHASRVDFAEETRTSVFSHLKRVRKQLGGRDPASLTPADVQGWVAANSDLKPSSLAQYLHSFALLLDFAGVDQNPARSGQVKLPARVKTEPSPPTADEFVRILTATAARYRLALVTLEQTGMRVGECVSLAWGDVDETGSRFRLRSEEVKTRRARWVEIPRWLMEVIAATRQREDRLPETPVFLGVTAEALRRVMGRACTVAGLAHFTPHDLRHRRATIWHHGGVPVRVMMERGGWTKSEIALEVYSHAMPVSEVARAALEELLVMPR